MSKRRLGDTPLTAVEQLANIHESLADDIFDVPSDADEESKRRASLLFDTAVDRAIASTANVKDVPPTSPKPPNPSNVAIPSEPKPTDAAAPKSKLNWRERWFKLHPLSAVLLSICWLISAIFTWGSAGLAIPIEIVISLIFTFVVARLEKDRKKDESFLSITAFVAAILFLIILPIPLGPLVFLTAGFRDRTIRKEKVYPEKTSATSPIDDTGRQADAKSTVSPSQVQPSQILSDETSQPEQRR